MMEGKIDVPVDRLGWISHWGEQRQSLWLRCRTQAGKHKALETSHIHTYKSLVLIKPRKRDVPPRPTYSAPHHELSPSHRTTKTDQIRLTIPTSTKTTHPTLLQPIHDLINNTPYDSRRMSFAPSLHIECSWKPIRERVEWDWVGCEYVWCVYAGS